MLKCVSNGSCRFQSVPAGLHFMLRSSILFCTDDSFLEKTDTLGFELLFKLMLQLDHSHKQHSSYNLEDG